SLERLASAQSAAGSDASRPKLRRAGQAKTAEPARPEAPLDPDRPKIRRSQAARQEQSAGQTPRQGEHEGRVYRDARRARDGQRNWSGPSSSSSASNGPVTMSATEMAETAVHGGTAPQSGSFRGLVENLQGATAHEEPKRRESSARIISVPARSQRQAKPQPAVQAAPAPQAQSAPSEAGKTPEGSPRVLICWLGKVDIGAAMRRDHINPGPVRMLIEHSKPFDHVILLTTQNPNVLENYRAWLAPCVTEPVLDIWRTQVHDLADHGLICTAVIEAVEHAIREFSLPATGEGITFHLSPGTPATHAMLLLLAASRYKGVRLVQTKINGTEQASEVLDIHVPDVVLKDASDDGLLPSFVSHEPLPMPAAAPEAQADDAEQAPEADGRAHFGHGARAARKRPMAHAFPSPRIQSDITDPYEGLRPPTNAPNMQTAPKEGDPPTISEALGEVYDKMQRISTMSVPVLLLGESGTGKSRLARFIHDWSGRSGKFICVDCAGLSDEVFISELFGQKQGDSPCAWRSREGAFRLANGGTLFLENVDALSASQQSMMLRMLAPIGETVVQLPGGAGSRAASSARMRIIASAGDALVAKMQSGEFRSDLFYRLSGVAARLPSVREYAPEEKENMLRSFFVNLQHRMGRFWSFSGDAWQALLDEDWPGNLREIGRML
ncbi:MAG: sigma-54-dependent Fis family transcriptional regulator, partial [Desulfovibrio sp.]|nr:sigma-54-dependent Fis family transcriptional regulator [Desulfovibrio sp.]